MAYDRYRWAQYLDGDWRKLRDDPSTDYATNIKENDRIRIAAHLWARRHGWRVESRTERRGRVLYLRFRPVDS